MAQVELECRFRPDGQVVAANAAYCQYFQCCPDTLAQQPQPPHLAQSIDSWPHLNLTALTSNRGQINHELQVQSPSGAIAWQQWYNQGIFDDQGGLVEVRAVGRDITRYKLIETRLQQQISQEQALGRIVDRIRQSLDIQEVFAVATAEAQRLLGCDRATIYQFTPDWGGYFVAESVDSQWVPLVTDNVRTLWVDTYLQEHQGGRYRYYETLAIEDIYLSGHSPCHLDILEQFQVRAYVVVPIFKEDQLWGLISAYHNTSPHRWQPEEITLLSQVARHLGLALHHGELLLQFKHAKEGAEQANRAKSKFLSHMSHELRTPLNAIIGYAQFMLRDHTFTPEQQSYLNTINASGEHLLSLINDILNMSKIEAGQMALVSTEFSLPDTLQQLVDILAAQAAEKATALTVTLDAEVPPYIRSDRGKLQQILLNLLGNSVKFTEAGTITLTVSVIPAPSLSPPTTETTRPPCYLRFTVTDTGSGIPEDQVQQLFQPFIQTQARANAPEGTGLGLAISHQFATLLQGNLVLESTSPQGSTFQLTLPVEPISTVAMQPRQVHHQVIGLAEEQPPVRILIAEDKAPSRQLMVKLMESVGLEVRAVTNGVEALAQWQTWQPQLIFMDLRMPVLDGYEATQRIKQAAGDSPPVIVALTASAFDADEQTALDYGCDDFVRKPIREADLFEVIAQHLGVRYRYQDRSPRAAPLPATDLFGHIATMPGDWVDRLYQAALTANRTTLDQLLDNLPESQLALAQALQVWVDNFRSDKIVALIEQIRDSSGSSKTNDPSC